MRSSPGWDTRVSRQRWTSTATSARRRHRRGEHLGAGFRAGFWQHFPREARKTWSNCPSVHAKHGRKRRPYSENTGRAALFSTTLALVALVPVACVYGIRPATPTPTPAPTPIPTIWVDEALEELFWMSVDLVGENSQMPEINRTLSFKVARETVRLFLFTILSGNVEHLEAQGISPFETPPYCIDLTSASMHLVELSQASSPSDAAPHVDNAAGALARLELDISRIGKVGRPDKQLCDKFEAEKRDAMGWPPSQEP